MTRDDAVAAVVRTGKTREQAEAVLDLLESGFCRRGWWPGEPLSREQVAERFNTFMGTGPAR